MSYALDGTPLGGYQPAQPAQNTPSTPQERYPQLNQILHTEEGFKRSIKFTGAADSVLAIVLAVAIIALVYNVVSIFQSFAPDNLTVTPQNFWMLFTSTTDMSGNFSPVLWVMTYLPLIAIPVVIILLIVKRLTLDGSISKVYAQFRQGGFIIDLAPTGVRWNVGNTRCQFYAAGPSTLPPDWLPAAAQRIAGIAANDPKSKQTKDYIRGLAKAAPNLNTVSPASLGDPGLPQGIYLTLMTTHDGRPHIAVPTSAAGQLRMYALKKDVPIA